MALIKLLTPPTLAGLFFCLASDMVQGFCFAVLQYNHIQEFTARFVSYTQLYRPLRKTVHMTLQGRFRLFAPFYRRKYQTDTSGYNAACATPGRCTGQHGRPIIIRYIRVQRCAPVIDPCQTAQHTADNASPAAYSLAPAPVSNQGAPSTRRSSPVARARRAARNHWRLSPQLFSGFRPIANKGEQ